MYIYIYILWLSVLLPKLVCDGRLSRRGFLTVSGDSVAHLRFP